MNVQENIPNRIKSELCRSQRTAIIDFIVIGSYRIKENPLDLDIAVIVQDDTDFYWFMEEIASTLAKFTKEIDTLVTCFPIKESDYIHQRSQFIKNIYQYGIKI